MYGLLFPFVRDPNKKNINVILLKKNDAEKWNIFATQSVNFGT